MKNPAKIKKVFFITYLVLLHVFVALLVYEKINFYSRPAVPEGRGEETTSVVPLLSPVAIPFEANIEANTEANNTLPPSPETVPPLPPPENNAANAEKPPAPTVPNVQIPSNPAGKLMIPVVGIKAENLQDTYTQSRSGGRVHNAIDIMAPGGTPVVAAADGEIVKFFDSNLGGITIYQMSADKKYIYYYAHLQRRAGNIGEKSFVKQGTVIGYVGDTGNSGAGNFHLHFTITLAKDPNRYWEGEDINPYPFLKEGIEARTN